MDMNGLGMKVRKILSVGLMVIGGLALVWIFVSFLMPGTSRLSKSFKGGLDFDAVGPRPPLGVSEAPSMGAPDFSRDNKGEVSQGGKTGGAQNVLTERKVIRNGTLALLVKKAEEAAAGIQALASKFEGFVENAQIYEVSDGIKAGTVTIRVPAARFDEAMGEVKKFAVKVEREQVTASDVTEHFTDLEAQLKNLRAQEQQYLEILRKADDVQDILSVTQYLNNVRASIERIQGQLQYLSRQVDMSTITATLTSEADVEVFGIRWRPLYVVKQAFRNLIAGFAKYVNAIIVFVFQLPLYILWVATVGVLAWLLWKLVQWVRRRFFPPGF